MPMTEAEKRRYAFYEAQYYTLMKSNRNWKRAYDRLAEDHRRLQERLDGIMKGLESKD